MSILSLGIAVVVGCSGEKPLAVPPPDPIPNCVTNISVNPASIVLHVGDSTSFRADACGVKPTDWRWHSSDTVVANVDSIRGVAYARTQGVATIVAQLVVTPSVTVAALVTVSK